MCIFFREPFLLFLRTTLDCLPVDFLTPEELDISMDFENKENFQEVLEASQVSADVADEQELLVEESLELNRQKKTLSAEDYQKFLDGLAQANKKIISVTPLDAHDRNLVQEVVACLLELKNEVLAKRQESLRQSNFIKEKVNVLITSGKVQIHQDEYKKSEESVVQYAGLLDNIVAEIDSEINYFNLFTGNDLPGQVVAWAKEPDTFVEYIREKIRFIKKYVKSIRKDLNVSFSRYNFGFQAQIKRVLQVEAYVRYHEHLEDQARAAAEKKGAINESEGSAANRSA